MHDLSGSFLDSQNTLIHRHICMDAQTYVRRADFRIINGKEFLYAISGAAKYKKPASRKMCIDIMLKLHVQFEGMQCTQHVVYYASYVCIQVHLVLTIGTWITLIIQPKTNCCLKRVPPISLIRLLHTEQPSCCLRLRSSSFFMTQ